MDGLVVSHFVFHPEDPLATNQDFLNTKLP